MPKRRFNLGAPMNNCLLTKFMNKLEVSILLLVVDVLLYGTQPSPKISFILWLAKRNRLLTLDKTVFLNKGVLSALYGPIQMFIFLQEISPSLNSHSWFGSFPHAFHFFPMHYITDSLIRGRSKSGVQGKFRLSSNII